MSAIFGFTGPPDERLLAGMAETLHHRGNDRGTTYSGPGASLAYRASDRDGHLEARGAGLYRLGDQVLVLAGYREKGALKLRIQIAF